MVSASSLIAVPLADDEGKYRKTTMEHSMIDNNFRSHNLRPKPIFAVPPPISEKFESQIDNDSGGSNQCRSCSLAVPQSKYNCIYFVISYCIINHQVMQIVYIIMVDLT